MWNDRDEYVDEDFIFVAAQEETHATLNDTE